MASYGFAPQVGGIETVGQLLAKRWVEQGHEVVVVTETASNGLEESPSYVVVRRPSFLRLLRLLGWADIFFQNNISLRLFWPWLLRPRPFYITHHTWIGHTRSKFHPVVLVKKAISRLAVNMAISRAIAEDVGRSPLIMGNPYDEDLFGVGEEVVGPRPRDFLFVGRLVRDKGVDLFLRALGRLHEQGRTFVATVAGDGPERAAAEELARELGMASSVEFPGVMRDRALADCYREHRVLVVPSRWDEPFGLVALEGLACGCQVVVAAVGGLPDAVGPAGRTFPRNDWVALSEILKDLPESVPIDSLPVIHAHLRRYTSRAVAAQYLAVFGGQAAGLR